MAIFRVQGLVNGTGFKAADRPGRPPRGGWRSIPDLWPGLGRSRGVRNLGMRRQGQQGGKRVRSATVIKSIFALLVGTLAAVAAHELVNNPRLDCTVNCG